jgi:hypothetical protein
MAFFALRQRLKVSPMLNERFEWTVDTEYREVWAKAGIVREEDLN